MSRFEVGLAAICNNYPMLIGYHHFNCHYEETHCSTILPADDYYAHGWVSSEVMILYGVR